MPLDIPLSVGEVDLGSPAVYGDCGQTSPERVTLVDLESRADTLPPFSSWVEFCLGSEPDCPTG